MNPPYQERLHQEFSNKKLPRVKKSRPGRHYHATRAAVCVHIITLNQLPNHLYLK